jgi:hypothetical protein
MKIDGQCHCGQVTYEAEIDPERVSVCHCDDCQRLTGSPYRVSVRTPRSDIRLTGNPPRVYVKVAESGNRRRQYFCPECGSPLFASDDDDHSGDWGIRWGSIRQRRELEPKRQFWCRSAVPWAGKIDELPGRETQ